MNKSLIYGTLLGDSWIYKNKRGSYTFGFSQVNKEYAKWKANLLGYEYRSYDITRFDKRTGKYYTNLTCHIKIPVEEKKELYSLFYIPKKIVTKEILNQLDEEGIAMWYMDDGNMYYNGNNCHLSIAVNGFTISERMLIINYFNKKFGLNFKISGKAIRLVSKKECEKFMKIVEEYIPESMSYKKLSSSIIKHKLKPKKERKKYSGRKVVQILKNGEIVRWDSVSNAADYLNLDRSTIYSNLTGKSKYCKNSKFEYV